MYKSILPETAFYGRGIRGPCVYLTDDAEAEFKAFQSVFPESTHLLCQFHLLQATWRWLWNAHHKIAKGDRKHCMLKFRSMVFGVLFTWEELRNGQDTRGCHCQHMAA